MDRKFQIKKFIKDNILTQNHMAIVKAMGYINNDIKNFDLGFEVITAFFEVNWNVPEFILKIFNNLFKNYIEITRKCFYLSNFFKDYNYTHLLLNLEIQKYISKIKLEDIEKEAKIWLIKFFLLNYEKNNFSEDYIEMMKEIYYSNKQDILKRLIKEDFYDYYKLLFLLDFNFRSYYTDLYEIWILKSMHRSKREIWEAKRKWNWFFKDLEDLDLEIFKLVFNEIKEEIDISEHLNIFSKDKLFYMSVIENKIFFDKKDLTKFIDFAINLKSNNRYIIFNLVNFIKKQKIDIFSEFEIDYILKIFKESVYYDVQTYLEGLAFNKNYLIKYCEIYSLLEKKDKSSIYRFLLTNLWKAPNVDDLFTLNNFKILEKNDFATQNYLDTFKNTNFKYNSYKEIIDFIIIFSNNNTITSSSLFENMSRQSWKVKYCLVKALKKLWIYNSYQFKEVRERCYFSSHLPFSIFHFIKYKILKK